MWHRFNDDLRGALRRAAALAERDGAPSLTTGHILQMMLEQGSTSSQIVSILGNIDALHSMLVTNPTVETSVGGDPRSLTVQARVAVDTAYNLAAELGDNSIGCEHVLLALAKLPHQTDAGRALASVDIGWKQCSQELIRLQRRRTVSPSGIDIPGLRLRKLTIGIRLTVGRMKRLTHVAAARVPYKQYVLVRGRTLREPYAFYRHLRRQPFYWDPIANCWIVTGYKQVAAALAEPRLSQRIFAPEAWSHNDLSAVLQREFRYLQGSLDLQMLFLDAPHQPRQRSLVAKRFTPRVIDEMRQTITSIASDMIDAISPAGRMDVMADLAIAFPLRIIVSMLGLPVCDLARFKKWSTDFFTYLNFESNLAQDVAAYQSVREAVTYFAALIPERLQEGQGDLISMLLQPDEHGERIHDDEVISNCLLLLATGHENTTRLIGTGLLALVRRQDQMSLLHKDPSLIGSAVEEMLRFDSPVQWTLRHVLEDVEIEGHSLKAGQKVQIGIAAANRDPVQFVDPDRFNVMRVDNRHIAFGHGPHFCLGAALTRIEAQILFASLLERFPRLRLDGRPEFLQDGLTFRGLKSLTVRWD